MSKVRKILAYTILAFVLTFTPAAADELGDTLSNGIDLYKFFQKSFLHNYSTFQFFYGPELSTFNNVRFEKPFSPNYKICLQYGYSRFEESELSYDYVYYSGERAFLSNSSSHLGIAKADIDDIMTDNWRFGFSYVNGYGYIDEPYEYDSDVKPWIILYHTGSLLWNHMDVENFSDNDFDNAKLDRYDEKFKFGYSCDAGIMYRISGSLYADLAFECSALTSNIDVLEYLPSAAIELLLQRSIDLFVFKLLGKNRNLYPVLNFIAKSTVSGIFYLFRSQDQYWPIISDTPITNYGVRFGFTIII